MKNTFGLDAAYAKQICSCSEDAHVKLERECKRQKAIIKTLQRSLKSCAAKLKAARSQQAAEPASQALSHIADPAVSRVVSQWNRLAFNFDADLALEEKRRASERAGKQRFEDIQALKGMGFELDSEIVSEWLRGGQGLVCPCTHKKCEGRFVVKMPRKLTALESERMEQEFETMALITGAPHTLPLAAIPGQPADVRLPHCLGIVMPFVQNITLLQIEGKFSDGCEKTMVWASSGMMKCLLCLAEAIEHLHSISLFHGDVKTSNIMIDPSLQFLTLADFGHTRSPATGTTQGNGTQGWRAPEQLHNSGSTRFRNDAARASDIWAVGVVALGFTVLDSCLFETEGEQQTPIYEYQDLELERRSQLFQEQLLSLRVQGGPTSAADSKRQWTADVAMAKVGSMSAARLASAGIVWAWAAHHALRFDYKARTEALREFIKCESH